MRRKIGIIGASPFFMAMAAQMESEQDISNYIPQKKRRKRKSKIHLKKNESKEKIHPNHKPFEFGGQTIYALNKKNAIKKAKKLGLL
jgi:hypothetical protein